jgi:hypothetical protein
MNQRNIDKLNLKLQVQPSASIGYGYAFKCDVKEVLEGHLREKAILLTVLIKDQELIDLLLTLPNHNIIQVNFRRKTEDEPYSIMPITGFVDSNKTSWELTSIQPD